MSYLPEPGLPDEIPAERLVTLLDAALDLAEAHDLTTMLDRMVERAVRVAQARYAALAIYAEGRITTFIHHGIDAETVERIGDYPEGLGLLGEVIAAAGPTRVDDIGADSRAVGFPADHPPMSSFLGVPVQSGPRRHGILYVTSKQNGVAFDDTDEQLLAALAALAACAVDNALLVDAERERGEAVLGRAAAEQLAAVRREMFERVIRAQETERERVARDLHDQVGQSLTSVLLALRIAENAPSGSDEARQRTEELRELITDTLDEVRLVAFDLRPAVLDDIGLITAIERLAASVDARLGLRVTVDVAGIDDTRRLPSETETPIYRIVQEALTNVARHAQTDTATVVLRAQNSVVRVEIHDEGNGFDLDTTRPSLGIGGMTERAALAGGTLSIETAPGAGTRIRLEVPGV
jgi:signal transduction histidine kinase